MNSATVVGIERHGGASRPVPAQSGSASLRTRMWRERWMYLFLLPGCLFFLVFRYVPFL
ncbi:MAG: hypothetical protein JOY61_14820, partial [Chloroflexi bacterium]|nr:hypothetical protein [Chloroflexota bacterium]